MGRGGVGQVCVCVCVKAGGWGFGWGVGVIVCMYNSRGHHSWKINSYEYKFKTDHVSWIHFNNSLAVGHILFLYFNHE